MNPEFLSEAFWQPYFTCEPKNISKDQLSAQLDNLSKDIPVREETVSFKHNNEEVSVTYRVAEFSFSCGPVFSIKINYQPDVDGCDISIFLEDRRSSTKHTMGWWDLARWHPYCLKFEELDALLEYWVRNDPRWENRHLPLLLLCHFVGLPDEDARQQLQIQTEEAKLALGLPIALKIPLNVADGNYRWENDEELGWVFTSDEYCCYSIRNRAHADSDEGQFPFLAFQEMMSEIKK
ncbi:MAG: hypothetical protein R3B84_13060 [Zavarzinella sp.]